MPIGVVDDSDFFSEVDSTSGIKEKLPTIITPAPKGRKEGDNNVPDSLRKIIGETANIEGRDAARDLAGLFGISDSSVSAYTNGSTSTASYKKKDAGLISFINSQKNKISKRAAKKLVLALDKVDDDKLEDLGARDLAGFARDMSVIIKNMETEETKEDLPNAPQFVVFAPTFVKEDHYDTIHVNE